MLQKSAAVGTVVTSKKSIANMHSLQFLLCVCPQGADHIMHLLASVVASHWALHKEDPRGAWKLKTDPDSTATAAIVSIEQKYGHVADISVVAKFKRINLMTCDRSEMAQAQLEFETSSPLPKKSAPSRAWALPTIRSIHETVSTGGCQVAESLLAVYATILRISEPV
jgi:hypothetical protein